MPLSLIIFALPALIYLVVHRLVNTLSALSMLP